jgi:DNA-directed RNA polymerase alpha subunit
MKHVVDDPKSKCDCRECWYMRGFYAALARVEEAFKGVIKMPLEVPSSDLASSKRYLEDDRLVDELEVSVRAANCFENANIKTMGELQNLTAAQLLRIRHFGRKTLKEVREVLASQGLKLRGDP